MYNSATNACSFIAHIFIKHPLLLIVLGLVGGVAAISAIAPNQSSLPNIESSPAFQEVIESLDGNQPLLKEAEKKFQEIKKHYQAKEDTTIGLTEESLQGVIDKIPECEWSLQQILDSPDLSESFAKLYFLDLVHELGTVGKAYTYYLNQ